MKTNMSTKTQSQPRSKPAEVAAWAWFEKDALRAIRTSSDEYNPATVIAVYVALCELASDAEGPTFTTSRHEIANHAGTSKRTVCDCLRILKTLGLLRWTQNHADEGKELLPSTYTLLIHTPRAGNASPRANGEIPPLARIMKKHSEKALKNKEERKF